MRIIILAVVTIIFSFTSFSTADFWNRPAVKIDDSEIYFKVEDEKNPNNYGVDVSTPVHHYLDPKSYQGKRYNDMMRGCYDRYDQPNCDATERARIDMNMDQPSKQHNYTEIGFKKWRVPKAAWELLKAFWDANKNDAKKEDWPAGNTYVNHWKSPSYMVSLEDGSLRGSGHALKQKIWDAIRPLLEEWVGRKLTETSMYGIRVYKADAVLATHVDRLPLVTSCIINVDQDLNEPWPIEVYSHDGRAHNVTMEPGEMVFYESHTVHHGRPFPLNGTLYANLFVHYIPVDHKEMNKQDFDHPFKKSSKTLKVGGHEQSNHAEEHIAEHLQALEDEHEEEGEDEEASEESYDGANLDGTGGSKEIQSGLHAAAARGDVDLVESILAVSEDKSVVNRKDANEWQAIHEAVRGGHTDVVKVLLEHGAELHHKTRGGGTPLWWARRELHEGHSLLAFLEELGAPEEGVDTDL